MPTRPSSLPGRLSAAGALLAVVALLAAACSADSAPGSLSDPREILEAAVTHLRAARTVHVEARVDGTLALGTFLGGPQASGRGLGLTGTRFAGDLDLAAHAAAIRFQVPALLGLEGELRQVGGGTYLESSLTSPGWHRLTGADLPVGAGRPLEWIDGLVAWLERPSVLPIRSDDDACPAGRCYVVHVTMYRTDVTTLASAAPEVATGLAGATVTLGLRIERASLVLSEADIRLDLGERGAIDVAATFTAWDLPTTIASPPPDQIASGPLLP